MLSDEQLQEIRDRVFRISEQNPATGYGRSEGQIEELLAHIDEVTAQRNHYIAEFDHAAHNCEELRQGIKILREAIQPMLDTRQCPHCLVIWPGIQGHALDCKLQTALFATKFMADES